MISVENVKDLIISTVVAMAERTESAQRSSQSPFYNRTNIYRCEDGRPICYCCLRVGHVAKYCWDRKYSCNHVLSDDLPRPLEHVIPSKDDKDVSGIDINELLKKLQGMIKELEQLTSSYVQEPTDKTQDRLTQVRRQDDVMLGSPVFAPDFSWNGQSSHYLYDHHHFEQLKAKQPRSRQIKTVGVT